MNKILFTLVAILLLNFAPLAARPELILHYKSLLLAFAAACLWLSQPAFSTMEAKRDQQSDRSSIIDPDHVVAECGGGCFGMGLCE